MSKLFIAIRFERVKGQDVADAEAARIAKVIGMPVVAVSDEYVIEEHGGCASYGIESPQDPAND